MMKKILLAFLSGLLGTLVMMVVMQIIPLTGLPKLAQPEIIAYILGTEDYIGWIIYFVVGAFFAVVYHFAIAERLPIESNVVKGLIWGFIVFVFATAAVFALPAVGITTPQHKEPVAMVALVSLIGHLVYGILVAIIEHDAEEGVEDE